MFDDDIDPRTKKPVQKDLSTMSVEELKAYKDDLLAEAERVEASIQSKSDYFGEADKFFKS
jgi:uncharacterized small protein (DUF1192 family)